MKTTISAQFSNSRCNRFTCLMLAVALPLSLPAAAKEKVAILNTGNQPGHYLQWDGTPIMPIGDSATQGWMEGGTNFNQTGYIDALSSRGVNIAMLWSYIATDQAKQVGDARIGYDAPEIWPWQGSTDGNSIDLDSFNQNYFDRLKDFVSYAESKDVIVLLTVHDGWAKTLFDRHPFNASQGNGSLTSGSQYVELADYNNEMPTAFNPDWNRQQQNQYFQERFADKLITELEPYSNVIYEMFNEGEWYDPTNRQLHEVHFLDFFADRTDALLMTNTDHITGDDPHGNPNADIPSFHQHSWTGHFGTYSSAFNHSPAKPHFMSESIPEFNDDLASPSIDEIRQSAWEISMAGAGWVAQNNTSFGWDPNTIMAGHSAARDQVYTQIGHAAKFYNDLGVEFWNMAPNGSLSSTGVATANVGTEYLVYANSGGNFTVNLAAAGDTVNVQWYNPRMGVLSAAPDITGGSPITPFTAPDNNDWVLWLQTEGGNPNPPNLPVPVWSNRLDSDATSTVDGGAIINPPSNYVPGAIGNAFAGNGSVHALWDNNDVEAIFGAWDDSKGSTIDLYFQGDHWNTHSGDSGLWAVMDRLDGQDGFMILSVRDGQLRFPYKRSDNGVGVAHILTGVSLENDTTYRLTVRQLGADGVDFEVYLDGGAYSNDSPIFTSDDDIGTVGFPENNSGSPGREMYVGQRSTTFGGILQSGEWVDHINVYNGYFTPADLDGIPGDFDGDGDVDGQDFLKWQRGESPNSGNASDLAVWEENFGTSGAASSAAAGAVPEPSAMVLLALGSAGLVTLRRGRTTRAGPSPVLRGGR